MSYSQHSLTSVLIGVAPRLIAATEGLAVRRDFCSVASVLVQRL